MYVLEGEILFHMGGVEHGVGTGGFAVAPRGVPHAFMVSADVYLLVKLDRDFTATPPDNGWETFYALEILREFGTR